MEISGCHSSIAWITVLPSYWNFKVFCLRWRSCFLPTFDVIGGELGRMIHLIRVSISTSCELEFVLRIIWHSLVISDTLYPDNLMLVLNSYPWSVASFLRLFFPSLRMLLECARCPEAQWLDTNLKFSLSVLLSKVMQEFVRQKFLDMIWFTCFVWPCCVWASDAQIKLFVTIPKTSG